jgi:hypothetical protein
MQYDLTNARLWFRDALPTTKPSQFYTLRDLMVLDNGDTFVWNNDWVKVSNPILAASGGGTGTPGTPGQDGKDATVQIGTVTVNTLPAGSQATASVTDSNPDPNVATLNFNFSIPQGVKGDTGATGAPGTGGGTGGVVQSNGWIEVLPNGSDDTANLQAAINLAFTSYKSIKLGGIYRLSTGLVVPNNIPYLHIQGWAELRALNQNPWTFISSPTPTDNGQAEGLYTFRRIIIENLVIKGTNYKQNGINLQATEGACVRYVWGYGLNKGIVAPFWLRGTIEKTEWNGCIEGMVVCSGDGLWNGATGANSCPNGTTLLDNRVYCHDLRTTTAVTVADGSNIDINGLVIEGGKPNIGLLYKSTSPTASGMRMKRFHYESTGGAHDSQVVIRSSTRTHIMDSPFFYWNPNWTAPQGNFIRLEGGGYKQIQIINQDSGKFYDGSKGAVIQHEAGTSYVFENCDDPLRSFNTIRPLINANGSNLGAACGFNAGANAICVKPISR